METEQNEKLLPTTELPTSVHDHDEQTQKIIKGLEKCYQDLIEYKRYKKTPLVVMRDGEIAYIYP
jgi:hypothetical protein